MKEKGELENMELTMYFLFKNPQRLYVDSLTILVREWYSPTSWAIMRAVCNRRNNKVNCSMVAKFLDRGRQDNLNWNDVNLAICWNNSCIRQYRKVTICSVESISREVFLIPQRLYAKSVKWRNDIVWTSLRSEELDRNNLTFYISRKQQICVGRINAGLFACPICWKTEHSGSLLQVKQ